MIADLTNFFSPGQPLPSDAAMIAKALEILEQSPHGQQLVNFTQKKEIAIKLIAAPQPVAYLPDKKIVYVGFNKNKPISPTRFILMLTGILREAQQEADGFKHPPLSAPLSEHEKTSLAKQEDKVWYMCAVATELNTLESLKKFGFVEELKIMGYNESLAIFLKQENK